MGSFFDVSPGSSRQVATQVLNFRYVSAASCQLQLSTLKGYVKLCSSFGFFAEAMFQQWRFGFFAEAMFSSIGPRYDAADDDSARVSSWCDSVSTLCIFVDDVFGCFHSHVPAVVLRLLGPRLDFPSCFCSHVPSCSSPRHFVPLLEVFRDVFVPPLVPHINKFTFGSEDSMYAEVRLQRCQLQFSTSILPRWHQGCVQSAVPALAFKTCSSNGPSSSFGSQVSVSRGA